MPARERIGREQALDLRRLVSDDISIDLKVHLHYITAFGVSYLADAICDRILHNAHRIVLKGPSRRKEAKLDS